MGNVQFLLADLAIARGQGTVKLPIIELGIQAELGFQAGAHLRRGRGGHGNTQERCHDCLSRGTRAYRGRD